MKNYNIYFVLSAVFPAVWVLVLGMRMVTGEWFYLFYGLYALAYLGVLQLITGIYLVIRYKHYPDWAKSGIVIYWLLTGLFFAFWIGLNQVVIFPNVLIALTFLGVPLLIAVYQFWLVYRLAGLRRRQLEKRAFLQLYNH